MNYKDMSSEMVSIREEIEKEIQDKYDKELEIVYQDAIEGRKENEKRLSKYRGLSVKLRNLKEAKKRRDLAHRKEVDLIIEKMLELENEDNSFSEKSDSFSGKPDCFSFSSYKPALHSGVNRNSLVCKPDIDKDCCDSGEDSMEYSTETYIKTQNYMNENPIPPVSYPLTKSAKTKFEKAVYVPGSCGTTLTTDS